MPETELETLEEPRSIGVDLDVYLPLFDDPSISDDDKRALLQSLWSIVLSFVQIGWGVHPIQHARDAKRIRDVRCGKVLDDEPDYQARNASMVELNDQFLMGRFGEAAERAPQIASES